MNPAEIENIARAERGFWWYRGQRRIFSRFVSPFLAGRTLTRVLEAGCGTGFESYRFQYEYRWPMFPLDLDSGGLAAPVAWGLPAFVKPILLVFLIRPGPSMQRCRSTSSSIFHAAPRPQRLRRFLASCGQAVFCCSGFPPWMCSEPPLGPCRRTSALYARAPHFRCVRRRLPAAPMLLYQYASASSVPVQVPRMGDAVDEPTIERRSAGTTLARHTTPRTSRLRSHCNRSWL